MKTALAILVIVLAVLACGCTSPKESSAPAAATSLATPAPAVVPALAGTWTGPMAGYDEGTGFTDYNSTVMSMVVTEQHGRIFTGSFTFGMTGTESRYPVAGVIGRDGRTFSVVEKENGYMSGTIVADNEIELVWMDDKTPFGVAIDTLKRE